MVEMVTLQCEVCEIIIERKAAQHRAALKRGRLHVFCSRKCGGKVTGHPPVDRKRECLQCGEMFMRDNIKQKFCSTACRNAARIKPKRKKESKVSRGVDYNAITIEELRALSIPPQHHAKIRAHARKIYAEAGGDMFCYDCGYDLHVDVCHYVPVSMFTDDTPIAVMNDVSNLVALCRNCHWEFDNGYLELKNMNKERK